MIDITLENFESDLIATSVNTPVLLDIWAEWCGPCKALGPVLERLEAEYEGRFILAKLDADAQPEIAGQLSQMFGVRSIPFCVMFAGGQPVDGFVGAIPPEQIREFLNKHLTGEGELVSAEETAEAEALIEEGHPEDAFALLENAIAKDPGNDEARYDLIKLLLAEGQVEAAKHVFLPVAGRATGPVPEARPVAFSRYIAAVQSAREGRAPAELSEAIAANKRDFEARFALAQLFWAAGEPTQAMDELLEIIMRDKTWQDQAARKTYVAILEVLTVPPPKPVPARGPAGGGAHGGHGGHGGPGAAGAPGAPPKLEIAGKVEVASANPLIDQYRRKLSMALN